MATVVKVHIDRSKIRHLLDMTRQELASWANKAMTDEFSPLKSKTPIDTGALRENVATRVQINANQDTVVWFYWRQPYAGILEESDYNARTPGTRIPWAAVGVAEVAVDKAFGEAVGRGLGKK